MTPPQSVQKEECEAYIDHQLVWDGCQFTCAKCFLEFEPSRISASVREETLKENYHQVGMLNGVYHGEVQYIPKHEALSVIDPNRAVDHHGNHVLSALQKLSGNDG